MPRTCLATAWIWGGGADKVTFNASVLMGSDSLDQNSVNCGTDTDVDTIVLGDVTDTAYIAIEDFDADNEDVIDCTMISGLEAVDVSIVQAGSDAMATFTGTDTGGDYTMDFSDLTGTLTTDDFMFA